MAAHEENMHLLGRNSTKTDNATRRKAAMTNPSNKGEQDLYKEKNKSCVAHDAYRPPKHGPVPQR